MPRKIKVYQTSQGFYDLALAAPSMKAALEAWGASMNLFHQGLAKESGDSDVIAAAMAKPTTMTARTPRIRLRLLNIMTSLTTFAALHHICLVYC